MRETPLIAGVCRVGPDFNYQISRMSADILLYAMKVLTVASIVAFVAVVVLLPNSGEFETKATEDEPPSKWQWAARTVTVTIIWHLILLAYAFLNSNDFRAFLFLVFPTLFLLHAAHLGISAYRFRINHRVRDRTQEGAKENEEARTRLGLD